MTVGRRTALLLVVLILLGAACTGGEHRHRRPDGRRSGGDLLLGCCDRCLAAAFRASFEATGGSVTGFVEVDRDATDVTGVLAEIAAEDPEAMFLPVTRPLADYVIEQASTSDALSEAVLVAADSVLNAPFLELEAAEGIFVAGPDLRYGDNANQSTGKAAEHVIQRFIDETANTSIR